MPLCGPSASERAILAFQLVSSPAEVAEIFGSEPCRGALVAAQYRGLWLDAFAFIPAYGAFLLLAIAAMRRLLPNVALAASALAATAVALDQVEGLLLLSILGDLPGGEVTVTALYWIVRAKLGVLGLAEIAIGVLLVRRRWIGSLMSVPVLAGGMTSLWLLAANPHNPAMMDAHAIAWGALFIATIVMARRKASSFSAA